MVEIYFILFFLNQQTLKEILREISLNCKHGTINGPLGYESWQLSNPKYNVLTHKATFIMMGKTSLTAK